MIYNFGDRKDLNEKVEKELLRMKEVYQKQEMSAAELAKLKKKMKEARRMEQRARNKKRRC